MNVLPVKIPFLGIKNNNSNNTHSLITTEVQSSGAVAFQGGTAKNAEALRALMHYGVPGIYSGKYVIPQEIIDKMLNNHTFSKTIRHIVKALKPYENRLLNVESQFYSIVKSMVKTNPNYHLKDVVGVIAPEHNKKLIEQQIPVFEEISALAEFMPEEQFKKFDSLMNTVCKRINREPVVLPFDLKELKSKLHHFANEYSKRNKVIEFDTMVRIMHFAKRMPETPKSLNATSKVKRLKQVKKSKSLVRKRAEILTQMELTAASSPLKNNPDLMKLFTQTRAKIYGTPVIVPFNRKSFIDDIEKITETLENTKLAHKINQAAIKLPTSHESLSAFVMKNLELSSDKIGYNMVIGSAGSIDHLIPFSQKGKNCIENYAITTSYYNSERAHRSIEHQLKKYPVAYIHCQEYVDRLIELCNQGIFKKVKLPRHYIFNFVKLMQKLSPKEKPLILNVDKLK